jgi:site-specific recombinase XerD
MIHPIYTSRYRRLDQKLRDGPVGPFVDELASVLLAQGYKQKYLRTRFTVIKALNRWLNRKKIDLSQLDSETLNQFIRYRGKQNKCMSERGELATLNTLTTIMKDRGVVPIEEEVREPNCRFEKTLSAYRLYLIEEKGLASTTIARYLFQNRKFLDHIFDLQPADFSAISAQNIVDFIRSYASGHGAGDSAMLVCSIRSFLRFLVFNGKIEATLVECIPAVSCRNGHRIPSHLSGNELSHFLKSSKGSGPVQRRNYAMFLLLARLGLRASEVVRLCLDDIDWEHGEVTIRAKGNKQVHLPLPKEVGTALAAYLKHARPACPFRNVFISPRAPYRPLKNGSVLSSIVNRAVKRAGLNPQNKGAHLLRHTLATECLRKGATLTEVGEILRHRNIDTTAIYAKVDFTRLRTLAMPWPVPYSHGGVR